MPEWYPTRLATHHSHTRLATQAGGVFFAPVRGTTTAREVCATIRSALTDAHVAPEEQEGGDGEARAEVALASVLRRLGPCLLLLDHWERAEETDALLKVLLQSAPELRLLVSCTTPVSFPGVLQRQV